MRAGEKSRAAAARPAAIVSVLASSGLFMLLPGCVLYGFVRDGITTWTPTLLADFSRGNTVTAVSFSLIIPLINACGMLLAYQVQRRGRSRNRRLMGVLMALCACICLPLIAQTHLLAIALLLGCCCACMAGLEPMLTALIPLEYSRENLVGLTAGMIDSLIYAGSALAGICAGMLYGQFGAGTLFICWAGAALLSAACALISGRMLDCYRAKQQAGSS